MEDVTLNQDIIWKLHRVKIMLEIHSVTSKLLGHRPLEAQNPIYFFFLSPLLSPFLLFSLPPYLLFPFSFLPPPLSLLPWVIWNLRFLSKVGIWGVMGTLYCNLTVASSMRFRVLCLFWNLISYIYWQCVT